jgi:hypothetical protein
LAGIKTALKPRTVFQRAESPVSEKREEKNERQNDWIDERRMLVAAVILAARRWGARGLKQSMLALCCFHDAMIIDAEARRERLTLRLKG